MEITANTKHGVSVFHKDERKTDRGTHVGVVCESGTSLGAMMEVSLWLDIKRNVRPEISAINIFKNGVR